MKTATVSIVLVLAFVAGGQAMGDTITLTETFSGTPDYITALTFDQFDDDGGNLELQSIKVTVSLEVVGGSFILDNDGQQPASGILTFGASGDIASTDVSLLDAVSQPVTSIVAGTHAEAFSLDPNEGDGAEDYDPSPDDGMQYDGGTENDSDFGFIGSAYFTTGVGFEGTGTYDIDIDVDTWSTYGGAGGVEYAVTPPTTSGSVEVVYTYFVPEPGTMALLALGGLALLRRRKR